MNIRLCGEVTSHDSVVMCAMIDINVTDYDVILLTNVVKKLQLMSLSTAASVRVIDDVILCNDDAVQDGKVGGSDEGNVVIS